MFLKIVLDLRNCHVIRQLLKNVNTAVF